MISSYKTILLLWIFILQGIYLESVNARPEYALRNGVSSCTACHASPVGGGIRNRYGKLYGSRNLGVSPHSDTGLYQADFRFLYYVPEHPKTTKHGLLVMNAMGAVNVPITGKEEGEGTSFVGSYDFVNLDKRDLYINWRPGGSAWASHVLVGRFLAPFGLMTDEHRTYVRMQTMTSYRSDFQTGMLLAGDPVGGVHYDWAVTNKMGTSEGDSLFWGQYLNLRWMPSHLPILLGASGSYHARKAPDPPVAGKSYSDPYATSVYTGLSFDRLTNNHLKGALLLEGVFSKHWNSLPGNELGPRYTFGDEWTNISSQMAEARSRGYYAQLTWDAAKRWTFLYKYDYILMDDRFSGDGFYRHGVGFRHYASSNLMVQLRAEHAGGGPPSLSDKAPGKEDAALMLLHLWF